MRRIFLRGEEWTCVLVSLHCVDTDHEAKRTTGACAIKFMSSAFYVEQSISPIGRIEKQTNIYGKI